MVNKETLDLITYYEGFVGHWYPDPAHGWKVPTVGYGHTDAAGEPKYKDTKAKTFTQQEAREILLGDLQKYEDSVDSLVTVKLNDNQRGALVSFTYNLGAGNLKRSTLLKKLNAGDFAGAAKEFDKWVNAGGKKLEGLVRRRAAEKALFLKEPIQATAVPTETVKAPTEQPKPKQSMSIIFILLVIVKWFFKR
jgi:lysozyme